MHILKEQGQHDADMPHRVHVSWSLCASFVAVCMAATDTPALAPLSLTLQLQGHKARHGGRPPRAPTGAHFYGSSATQSSGFHGPHGRQRK